MGIAHSLLEQISPDRNLFDLGILDSLTVIKMAACVEKEFEIRILTRDFEPSNFNTLEGVERMLTRYLADDGGHDDSRRRP